MGIRKAITWCGVSLLAVQIIGSFAPVPAHETEVSGEVGGTAHIEPNDSPQAGTPSLAWFALTRQGGELIPLEACTCKLSIYTQPHQPADAAIAEPSLRPISAEGYQNVPGADITFPQVGAYNMVLQGQPKTPNDFSPFELTFDVTVAAGQSTTTPDPVSTPTLAPSPIASPTPTNLTPERANWLFWAIPVGAVAIVLPFLFRSRKA